MSFTDKKLFTYTPLNKNKDYFLYVLVFSVFLVFMQHFGHGGDTGCWKTWSIYIFNNGIGNIYFSGSDYPPLYYYVLSFYGNLMGSEESIIRNIYCLKFITFVCEFSSVFLLFRYVKKELQPWVFLLIILHPGFFYNSLIWGQVDGIFGFLIMSTILLVIHRQNTLAILLFILCLNFKIQSIIFLPLFILLLLHNVSDYKGLLYTCYVLMAMFGLETLIILPFIKNNTTELLIHTIINSVDKYPNVSMNAYNLWYWFFDGSLVDIRDTGTWQGLTYKTWGIFGFFISSAVALTPIALISILNVWKKTTDKMKYLEKVFLSAALITILFFFFNTQMHERYSHYALIFFAAYFALTQNYLPFLLCAVAYFFNMESVFQALGFPNYGIALFDPEYIAGLYMILIIYTYYLLYAHFELMNQFQTLFTALNKKSGIQ